MGLRKEGFRLFHAHRLALQLLRSALLIVTSMPFLQAVSTCR
ncbi:MAG: hypothetical protein VW440_06690 [Bordetella sp.]